MALSLDDGFSVTSKLTRETKLNVPMLSPITAVTPLYEDGYAMGDKHRTHLLAAGPMLDDGGESDRDSNSSPGNASSVNRSIGEFGGGERHQMVDSISTHCDTTSKQQHVSSASGPNSVNGGAGGGIKTILGTRNLSQPIQESSSDAPGSHDEINTLSSSHHHHPKKEQPQKQPIDGEVDGYSTEDESILSARSLHRRQSLQNKRTSSGDSSSHDEINTLSSSHHHHSKKEQPLKQHIDGEVDGYNTEDESILSARSLHRRQSLQNKRSSHHRPSSLDGSNHSSFSQRRGVSRTLGNSSSAHRHCSAPAWEPDNTTAALGKSSQPPQQQSSGGHGFLEGESDSEDDESSFHFSGSESSSDSTQDRLAEPDSALVYAEGVSQPSQHPLQQPPAPAPQQQPLQQQGSSQMLEFTRPKRRSGRRRYKEEDGPIERGVHRANTGDGDQLVRLARHMPTTSDSHPMSGVENRVNEEDSQHPLQQPPVAPAPEQQPLQQDGSSQMVEFTQPKRRTGRRRYKEEDGPIERGVHRVNTGDGDQLVRLARHMPTTSDSQPMSGVENYEENSQHPLQQPPMAPAPQQQPVQQQGSSHLVEVTRPRRRTGRRRYKEEDGPIERGVHRVNTGDGDQLVRLARHMPTTSDSQPMAGVENRVNEDNSQHPVQQPPVAPAPEQQPLQQDGCSQVVESSQPKHRTGRRRYKEEAGPIERGVHRVNTGDGDQLVRLARHLPTTNDSQPMSGVENRVNEENSQHPVQQPPVARAPQQQPLQQQGSSRMVEFTRPKRRTGRRRYKEEDGPTERGVHRVNTGDGDQLVRLARHMPTTIDSQQMAGVENGGNEENKSNNKRRAGRRRGPVERGVDRVSTGDSTQLVRLARHTPLFNQSQPMVVDDGHEMLVDDGHEHDDDKNKNTTNCVGIMVVEDGHEMLVGDGHEHDDDKNKNITNGVGISGDDCLKSTKTRGLVRANSSDSADLRDFARGARRRGSSPAKQQEQPQSIEASVKQPAREESPPPAPEQPRQHQPQRIVRRFSNSISSRCSNWPQESPRPSTPTQNRLGSVLRRASTGTGYLVTETMTAVTSPISNGSTSPNLGYSASLQVRRPLASTLYRRGSTGQYSSTTPSQQQQRHQHGQQGVMASRYCGVGLAGQTSNQQQQGDKPQEVINPDPSILSNSRTNATTMIIPPAALFQPEQQEQKPRRDHSIDYLPSAMKHNRRASTGAVPQDGGGFASLRPLTLTDEEEEDAALLSPRPSARKPSILTTRRASTGHIPYHQDGTAATWNGLLPVWANSSHYLTSPPQSMNKLSCQTPPSCPGLLLGDDDMVTDDEASEAPKTRREHSGGDRLADGRNNDDLKKDSEGKPFSEVESDELSNDTELRRGEDKDKTDDEDDDGPQLDDSYPTTTNGYKENHDDDDDTQLDDSYPTTTNGYKENHDDDDDDNTQLDDSYPRTTNGYKENHDDDDGDTQLDDSYPTTTNGYKENHEDDDDGTQLDDSYPRTTNGYKENHDDDDDTQLDDSYPAKNHDDDDDDTQLDDSHPDGYKEKHDDDDSDEEDDTQLDDSHSATLNGYKENNDIDDDTQLDDSHPATADGDGYITRKNGTNPYNDATSSFSFAQKTNAQLAAERMGGGRSVAESDNDESTIHGYTERDEDETETISEYCESEGSPNSVAQSQIGLSHDPLAASILGLDSFSQDGKKDMLAADVFEDDRTDTESLLDKNGYLDGVTRQSTCQKIQAASTGVENRTLLGSASDGRSGGDAVEPNPAEGESEGESAATAAAATTTTTAAATTTTEPIPTSRALCADQTPQNEGLNQRPTESLKQVDSRGMVGLPLAAPSYQMLTKDALAKKEQNPDSALEVSMHGNWGDLRIQSSCASSSQGGNENLYEKDSPKEFDRYKQKPRPHDSLVETFVKMEEALPAAHKKKEDMGVEGSLVPTFIPAANCTNASDFSVRCFVARLRCGITVIKHNRARWSRSTSRELILLPDGKNLSWKPVEGGEEHKGKRPQLDLTKCKEVRHAWSRDPETRKLCGTNILRKKLKDENTAARSLSLIFANRTLDMTASSADSCKVLMEGFSALCYRLQLEKLQNPDDHESGFPPDSFHAFAREDPCDDDDWESTVYAETTASMTRSVAFSNGSNVPSWGL